MAAGAPAPIDAEAINLALAPFGRSRTLPAAAYRSHDVFEWEMTQLFEGSWVCVGPASGGAANAWPVRAGGETVLLVRDREGTVRTFFNVCRHRGHELVDRAAEATVLRCPYHAWVYRLDGGLRQAPGFLDLPGFDPSEHGLVPVPLRRWHGWLFVNPSGDAPTFEDHVGDLDALVAPHRPEALVVAAREDYEVAANWKIITENYHECCHCPSIHPQLCRLTPPDSGVNLDGTGAWVGGPMDLVDGVETMSLTGDSGGAALAWLNARRRRQVPYYGLFPNLLISLHPDYVLTHRLEPVAPDRTRVVCECFPPEVAQRDGFDPAYARDFWDVTNRQDWQACEGVQRGMASRGYRQGPLSPREQAVYQFVTRVARSYLGGGLVPPSTPEPGRTAASAPVRR